MLEDDYLEQNTRNFLRKLNIYGPHIKRASGEQLWYARNRTYAALSPEEAWVISWSERLNVASYCSEGKPDNHIENFKRIKKAAFRKLRRKDITSGIQKALTQEMEDLEGEYPIAEREITKI